jgi:hypothetical protein
MNRQIFSNATLGSVLGASLDANATVMTLAAGWADKMPVLANGDYALVTLTQPGPTESTQEIIKVTGRVTPTGNDFTIVRAWEGPGAAASWPAGSKAEIRITTGLMARIGQDPAFINDSNTALVIHAGRPGVRDNSTRVTERSVWELRGKAVAARFLYVNAYNLIPDAVAGIAANSLAISVAGAGYNNGTYPLVATGAGGLGSGFTGTVTVAGGAVTAVALTTKGSGYPAPAAGGVTFSFSGAGTPTTPAVITGSTQYTIGTTTFANAGAKAYSAPSFENVLLQPQDLIGNGAIASGVIQFNPTTLAVSAAGRRSYLFGNWFDITNPDRTDGGEGTVLVHDLYISNNGWVGTMGDGATDDCTKFIVRPKRRRAFIYQNGDACTTPSLFTNQTLRSQSICVGVEYVTLDGTIRTVYVGNDSIPEGRVPGFYGEGFVMDACDVAESLTGVKYELANASWSGSASTNFYGVMGDLFDPNVYTGLNGSIPLGIQTSIALLATGTPNDYTYGGTGVSYPLNTTQIAKNRSGYGNCKRRMSKARTATLAYNISPVDDTVKDYGPNANLVESYNAEFNAATYKGVNKVIDVFSVVAGVRNANGQMLPKRNGPLSPTVTNGGSGGYTNANTTVTFSPPPAGGRQATGQALCFNGSVIAILMTDYGDGYLGQTSYGPSTLYTCTITTTGAGTGATATVQAGLSLDGIHDNKAAQAMKARPVGYALAFPSL